jgi:TRAP-type C4-dicarboxylate transport system substrate-binding protein
MCIIFNTEVLEGLPRDMRNLIKDSGDVWLDKMIELDNATIEMAISSAQDANHTFTYLTDAEIMAFYDMAKGPVHDAWIAEAEAAGLPGQEVYDLALELAENWQ